MGQCPAKELTDLDAPDIERAAGMENPAADGFWALMHLYTGLVRIIVVGKRHITIVSYRRVGTYPMCSRSVRFGVTGGSRLMEL